MVAVELDDCGLADSIRTVGVAKFERTHAIDNRQYATTQRRKAGYMRRCSRNGDKHVQFYDRFDSGGGQSDPFATNGPNQQKGLPLPLLAPAALTAISKPARS